MVENKAYRDLQDVLDGYMKGKKQVCLCPECGEQVELTDPSGITSFECKNAACKKSFLFAYKLLFIGDDKRMKPHYTILIYPRSGNEVRVESPVKVD